MSKFNRDIKGTPDRIFKFKTSSIYAGQILLGNLLNNAANLCCQSGSSSTTSLRTKTQSICRGRTNLSWPKEFYFRTTAVNCIKYCKNLTRSRINKVKTQTLILILIREKRKEINHYSQCYNRLKSTLMSETVRFQTYSWTRSRLTNTRENRGSKTLRMLEENGSLTDLLKCLMIASYISLSRVLSLAKTELTLRFRYLNHWTKTAQKICLKTIFSKLMSARERKGT